MVKTPNNSKKSGFTLVEALVGVALTSVVFLGIFGAYRLGLKVIGVSKNKITATAIANSRIEMIRNLEYESVGTVGAVLPNALGSLEPVSTQTMNGGVYQIETKVKYVADPADGSGADDSCNLDYKKVDIDVSWEGNFSGSVGAITEVAPQSLVQESQSCMSQPGGVLEVTVFDNAGVLVPSPLITIYNAGTNNVAAQYSPTDGKYPFSLEVGSYRVEVEKSDYSRTRTYGTDEVAVPDSPNPAVLNGELTPVSLSIDRAAAISVDGVTPTGTDGYADSFVDDSKVSQLSDVQINAGAAILAGPPYAAGGEVVSSSVAPADIVAWNNLIFDHEIPAATNAVYHILFFDGSDWVLVPDADLAQNSAGFKVSPVNLAALDKNKYSQLRIKGLLSTSDPAATPYLRSWELNWTTSAGSAVANAVFHMRGAKTIGEDDSGNPVYKYSQDLVLDGAGHLLVSGIDGDSYIFTVDPAGGFNSATTDHDPPPVTVAAGETLALKLFLRAQNAFRATVRNDVTLAPVFAAQVRLSSSSLIYDKTAQTGSSGQSYFAPLQNGVYEINIAAPGYDAYSGTVTISGETETTIDIHQQE